MQNNWEPYIGQKVVSLVDCTNGRGMRLIKDNIYTVDDTVKCKGCDCINVSVREFPGTDDRQNYYSSCGDCETLFDVMKCWIPSWALAPITEQYSDATAEIIEKFKPVEETADQPVRVLETN